MLVLGTTFLVRRYATDTAALIVVRDGKVMVRAGRMGSVVATAVRLVMVEPGAMHEAPIQQVNNYMKEGEMKTMTLLYSLTALVVAAPLTPPPGAALVLTQLRDTRGDTILRDIRGDTNSKATQPCPLVRVRGQIVDSVTRKGIEGIKIFNSHMFFEPIEIGITDKFGKFDVKYTGRKTTMMLSDTNTARSGGIYELTVLEKDNGLYRHIYSDDNFQTIQKYHDEELNRTKTPLQVKIEGCIAEPITITLTRERGQRTP